MSKGLVIVNTGPGKGKTTAALGQALRASGSGLRVLITQFIKNSDTGELAAFEHVPNVEIRQMGLGMIRKSGDTAEDKAAARAALDQCREAAASGQYGLLVLDEICIALKYGLLESADVLEFLSTRPEGLHVVLTGRDCPEAVMEAADTVTRMEAVKHHFQAGVKSMKGIEY